MPNETAHVVGYMLYPEGESWTLCGCLTWFGELTYVFKLGITEQNVERINVLPCTKMAYFNNVDRQIAEDESTFVFVPRFS